MTVDPFELLNRHVTVSRETFDRLKIYHDLLFKWQPKINLVSSETLNDVWQRHFLDSIQLYPLVTSGPLVDMGSGAGFPGMVLAIMGVSEVHLVESDGKKIAFLQEVTRLTKTAVNLHHSRVEETKIPAPKVITARATASLINLFTYASKIVSHETICLFPKGKNYSMELKDASKEWLFDHDIIPSVTDREGVILKISNIRRGT